MMTMHIPLDGRRMWRFDLLLEDVPNGLVEERSGKLY